MTLMEKDFSKFLSELGYSKQTVNIYPSKLTKVAHEIGYKSLVDLADNVFILLNGNKYKYNDRKHEDKILSAVKKNRSLLILFNSFLLDIGWKQNFFQNCSLPKNCMGFLSTVPGYEKGKMARQLIDIDNNGTTITDKQYFSMYEVEKALPISERELERWNTKDIKGKLIRDEPHMYTGIPSEIKDNKTEIERYSPTLFTHNYYKLNELNKFLDFIFLHGEPRAKEKYM